GRHDTIRRQPLSALPGCFRRLKRPSAPRSVRAVARNSGRWLVLRDRCSASDMEALARQSLQHNTRLRLPGPPAIALKRGKPGWRPRSASAGETTADGLCASECYHPAFRVMLAVAPLSVCNVM